MPTNSPKIIQLPDAEAAVADIRRADKRVVTFLGFSGSGYEDTDGVRGLIEGVLTAFDPGSILINAGGTTDGIGMVYPIAKDRGFSTVGIVSSLAEKEKAKLSPDADTVYIVADDTWGGLLPDGRLSPTSSAMVDASDEMVAIGGDEIARDELSAARTQQKRVRYIPAEMNHAAAKRKAMKNGRPEPHEFRGAAYQIFGDA